MRMLLLGLGLLLVTPMTGAMDWRELAQEISRVEAGETPDTSVIQRLGELVEGVVIYTRALQREEGASPLFCGPENTTFHLDEFVSLIREQARLSQAEGTEPVVHLLLQGLVRRFPCPGRRTEG